VISRFEDIWQASMDNEHYTTTKGTTQAQLVTKVQPLTPMLNMMDPPQHTQMRSKVAKFFMPGKVRRLEASIQQIVDDAYAPLRERDEADLFNDFASKVSVKVACLANGFPMEDSDLLNALVWRFFGREEGHDGMTEDGVAAMMEMGAYFAKLIERLRRRGLEGDSVVELLLDLEVDGEKLDDEAAASHLTLFLIGGAETFPKVFSSAVHRLWQHAEQRAECVADPALLPEAFREVLRFDMPTQFLMRSVTRPHEIRGEKLEPGQPVLFLYPAANRDPREFSDPDRFDIHRAPERILSFGHGIHGCIGQNFAKMEAKLCLQKLLADAPRYEVQEDQLSRLRTEFVQGWATMPVVFDRG
jgi:cytochrome P450